MLPHFGDNAPVIILKIVVLPAPLGPKIEKNSNSFDNAEIKTIKSVSRLNVVNGFNDDKNSMDSVTADNNKKNNPALGENIAGNEAVEKYMKSFEGRGALSDSSVLTPPE